MPSLEEIYRLYFSDVFYYLLYLSKDRQLAEDLTSEVFFKVIKHRPDFQTEASIKSYLLTTARHSYIDQLKKKGVELVDLEDWDLAKIQPSPEEDLISQEEQRIISSAIAQLDEPQRTIAKLRLVEGWSFAAIGQIYGRSPNWACVTCHRARQKLKDLLEDYYDN